MGRRHQQAACFECAFCREGASTPPKRRTRRRTRASAQRDRFNRDFLLTLVTLYWVTGTIGTSIRDYLDNRAAGTATLGRDDRVTVPTGIANFHHNFVSEGVLPREWAERIYAVEHFIDMPRGGHFAAAEEPELLAADLAAFFASL